MLPNRIRCGDLYRLVASKYAQYLKVPVIDLIRHRQSQRQQQQHRLRHTSSSSSMSNLNVNTTEAVDVRKSKCFFHIFMRVHADLFVDSVLSFLFFRILFIVNVLLS